MNGRIVSGASLVAAVVALGLLPVATFAHPSHAGPRPPLRIPLALVDHVLSPRVASSIDSRLTVGGPSGTGPVGHLLQPTIRQQTQELINAQSLQIPWTKWPGQVKSKKGTSIPVAGADNPNTNLFSAFHQGSYRTHGLQADYSQNATLVLDQAKDEAAAFWMGSEFSTADQASAWVNDAVTELKVQNLTSQSCYLAGAPDCRLFILPVGLAPGFEVIDVAYAIWSDQNLTGELAILGAESVAQQHTAAIGQDLQQLMPVGRDTLNGALGVTGSNAPADSTSPPQPTITIDSIRVLHNVRGRLRSTDSVHLSEIAFFFANFHVSGIGVYLPSGSLQFYAPEGRVEFLKGGNRFFKGSADLQTAQSGNLFFSSEGTLTKKSVVGKVRVRFTTTLSSARARKSRTFTLKK